MTLTLTLIAALAVPASTTGGTTTDRQLLTRARAQAAKYHRQRDDLQHRLTVRVRQVRQQARMIDHLRHLLVASTQKPVSLRDTVDPCTAAIVDREDPSWDPHVANTSTGAYGLPQALPGSKMASAGSDWRDNPRTQLRWMDGYMRERYGSACAALAFQRAHGWY